MHFHHSMFNKPFHISCKVHYFYHSIRTTSQVPGHTASPSVSQEYSIYLHVSHHCSFHSDGMLEYNNKHVIIQQVKTLDTDWPSVFQEYSIYQHVSHHCSFHSDGMLKYNNIYVFIQQVKTLDTQLGLQCPRSVVYTCMYHTTVLSTLMACWNITIYMYLYNKSRPCTHRLAFNVPGV